jgi:hypothetical protein
MTRLRGPTGLILCASLAWAGSAHADAVTDWNAITIPAVAKGRPGAQGLLDIGLVQAAVHDAVQAIDGRFEPYHVKMSGAEGSREAAAVAAAYYVLIGMYPTQTDLTTTYEKYLVDHNLQNDPGLAVGKDVADAFLHLRRNPPDPPLPPYLGGTDPGEWRPTPPAFAPGGFEWMATSKPYTFESPDQFRMGPPPNLGSSRYRREYDEVRTLGALADTDNTKVKRTAAQTDLAYFYADNFPALVYRTVRAIAIERKLEIRDSARLFALVGLATADAGITAWDSKYHFSFWRPVTAIWEGNNDGNGGTVGDPDWLPFITTPNYPDHSSGANNLVGSMTRTLARFFGTDEFTFKVTSLFDPNNPKVREYEHFSDMAADVVNVRIYQGIHFRTADEVARKQGQRVAEWVFGNVLQPVER